MGAIRSERCAEYARITWAASSESPRSALDEIAARDRSLVEERSPGSELATSRMPALLARPELKHLIIGPPGSGKTHALWRTAGQLLAAGEVVPLYLPAAQLTTWAELVSLVSSAAPDLSPSALFSDPRVCVLIDGWSEFAPGEHAGERHKALSALRSARVIANGKFVDAGDTAFKAWSLELLTPDQVARVLSVAYPGEPMPSPPVIELLRLPIVLSIRVFAGTGASAVGGLLRQFHDRVARGLPEAFTEALAEAVAEASLADDRSFGRFASHLQALAGAKSVADPMRLLQRLGTIVERGGQAFPIHDLYWSWLAGRGLLAKKASKLAVGPLHTRESYALALQSGACADDSDVHAVLDDDLVLAATLDRSRRATIPTAALATALDRALSDPRLAIRSRGALAVLEAAEPVYLRRALNVLSELTQSRLYVPDWPLAIRPELLFPHRATVADWLGSDGSEMFLDAVAERGGPEWTPWLEQVAIAGKISLIDALAAALGCGSDLPAWGEAALDALIASKPWKLRAATARRSEEVGLADLLFSLSRAARSPCPA